MTRYRKSLIVVLLYLIPAVLLMLIIVGSLYLFTIDSDLVSDPELCLMVTAIIGVVIVVFYLAFQTSISVDVSQDELRIRRLFKTRYQGYLSETHLRVHFSRSSKLLRPSGILIFVRNDADDKEIRVVANGLGESRTNRLLERSFGASEPAQTNVIQTRKPKIKSY